MDNQDKDQDKRDDFYSQGKPFSFSSFFGPPKQTQDEHDQLGLMEEIYRRYQECNRGAFGTQTLRHSYLRDSYTGESVGKGNLGVQEEGPSSDSCYWLLGDKSQQKGAFKDLKHSVETEEKQPNGLPGQPGVRSWFPGTQDCHTMKDHSVRKHGGSSYTSRVGEHNTRPKVTPEEDQQVKEMIFQQKVERAKEKGKPPPTPPWQDETRD